MMRLYEFLDSNDELTPYHDGSVSGYTFILDGRTYFVGFNDEGDDTYYMSFTGTDSRGRPSANLLGHNKPYKVFGNVASAICRFINENDPDQVSFVVDDAEEKRVGTYDRLLDYAERSGMLPSGYVWDRDGNYNYWIFKQGYR